MTTRHLLDSSGWIAERKYDRQSGKFDRFTWAHPITGKSHEEAEALAILAESPANPLIVVNAFPLTAKISQPETTNTNDKTMLPQSAAFRGNVSITRESYKDSLTAYAALVGKNSAITDIKSALKANLAAEAGAIFASELRFSEDAWMSMPLSEAIKAADVSETNLGTLAGTLVLQRSLPLLKFTYPMLATVLTDFSSEPGQWMQTEATRIVVAPAVTEYDPSLDTNGRPKGWLVVTPAQTIDRLITLTKHVGIPMIFGVQTLAATIRNLFGEQTEAALNALAGYFVNMITALMTPANFNAYAQIADAGGATANGSTTLTLDSTAGVYPGQEVSGVGIPPNAHIKSVTNGTHAEMTMAATADGAALAITLGGGKVPNLYQTYVKAMADFDMASLGEIGAAFDTNQVPFAGRSAMLGTQYYQRLAQDPTFNTFFAAVRSPDVINKGILPELQGFNPQKAPYFPTDNNRVGFAYHKAAIIMKSRLAIDYTKAVNAIIPGSLTTVTDPDSGLSVSLTQRVDLVGSYAEMLIDVMLGAAVGDPRAGIVLTKQ